MSIQTMIQEAKALSAEEREQLIQALIEMSPEALVSPRRKRKLHEFRGLGAHAYDGTDAQDYINQLRDEWDER